MATSQINQTLIQSVGGALINKRGNPVGKIVEITQDKENHNIEYLILESAIFFGPGNRFFAIPASSRFISTNGTDVILELHEDDIQFAKGVAADKCPKPNLKYGNSIFELYNYSRIGSN